MRLVKASYQILTDLNEVPRAIERAGRSCYKSESKIKDGTADPFCRMLIGRGHESVIEHASAMVKFVIDRGVSHEMVRHRLCSFSQESTRYCNYHPEGKVGEMVFIIPPWVNIKEGEYKNGELTMASSGWAFEDYQWFCSMYHAEHTYNNLIEKGWKPEQARSVLPNSLKTELTMTANMREWRHIFKLRTAEAAHPQMRQIMIPLLQEFKTLLPCIFDGD